MMIGETKYFLFDPVAVLAVGADGWVIAVTKKSKINVFWADQLTDEPMVKAE